MLRSFRYALVSVCERRKKSFVLLMKTFRKKSIFCFLWLRQSKIFAVRVGNNRVSWICLTVYGIICTQQHIFRLLCLFLKENAKAVQSWFSQLFALEHYASVKAMCWLEIIRHSDTALPSDASNLTLYNLHKELAEFQVPRE